MNLQLYIFMWFISLFHPCVHSVATVCLLNTVSWHTDHKLNCLPANVRYVCAYCNIYIYIYIKLTHRSGSQLLPFKAYWLRDAQTGLTFNNCTLCPHCIYVFCIYLRTNSDLCHSQHKLFGFYNPDEKCLQRGTDWVFK